MTATTRIAKSENSPSHPALKVLLLLLFFIHFSFADFNGNWLPFAGTALILSAALLALTYMIGIGFQVNELKFLASEELYQLLATVLIIGMLFASQSFFNSLSEAFGFTSTFQNESVSSITSLLANHSVMFSNLTTYSSALGQTASQSAYCSFQSMGFNLAPCGSFSALIPIPQTTLQVMAFSVAELSSLLALINFGQSYAFALLLPIGILLRTFKTTRGAGGIFIGLAAALFLFLPLCVVFMEAVTSPSPGSAILSSGLGLSVPSCNVGSFSNGIGASVGYANSDAAIANFESIAGQVNNYLYIFLIEATLTCVASVAVLFISFRWISKLAGVDVELSSLMRIA